jgi:hypothetical protein
MNVKTWLCSSLLAAISVAPVFAGTNDAADAKSSPPVNAASSSTAAEPPAAPLSPQPSVNPTPALGSTNLAALVGVLATKGVLSPSEANSIRNAAPDARLQLLVDALNRKGLLNAADLSATSTTSPPPAADSMADANPAPVESTALPEGTASSAPPPTAQVATGATKAEGPKVVNAVAVVRVLPVDPPVKGGLVPAFKIGGISVTPYGFIKATAVKDSSSPNGDDFPFPGIWLNSSSVFNTGPTTDPSFHLKARSTRFGANFEWPDISSKLTLTGRIEGDFEQNFSEVDNADVTSIRNPAPRLRLAYVRMDYAATDKTDLFFEGGQNWSIFGSNAVPNLLETTFFGAFWGTIWERTPQFRFGVVKKLSAWRNLKFSPEVALMMPSTGQIYKLGNGLGQQLGEGERQGADSGRPELEARTVLQFTLDPAPGVTPAQIIWSGYEGRRTSITTNGNFTTAQTTALAGTSFAKGFTDSSNMYGNQLAIQLPTRWATLVASVYQGGDMRFMLGGQLSTYFTDTTGLYQVQQFATVDGVAGTAAGPSLLGCSVNAAIGTACTAAGGVTQVAKEHPIGAFGGFINLGLPLSRWFNADPKGHNAGWQLYLNVGKDQVVHHDAQHALGIGCTSADALTPCDNPVVNPVAFLPLNMGKMAAATLYYKINQWCTFGFEQSYYATRTTPDLGTLYVIAGKPSFQWQDQRSEFGPIFTF